MSDIEIRKIEIIPDMQSDKYDIHISYRDAGGSRMESYNVSMNKAVEYYLSKTKKFNSLYISALERALQLFNWDVLGEED